MAAVDSITIVQYNVRAFRRDSVALATSSLVFGPCLHACIHPSIITHRHRSRRSQFIALKSRREFWQFRAKCATLRTFFARFCTPGDPSSFINKFTNQERMAMMNHPENQLGRMTNGRREDKSNTRLEASSTIKKAQSK